MDIINLSFERYCQAFPKEIKNSQTSEIKTETFLQSEIFKTIDYLDKNGFADLLIEWFLDKYQSDLREIIVPKFWNYFIAKNYDEDDTLRSFEDAVGFMYDKISWYQTGAEVLEKLGQSNDLKIQQNYNNISSKIKQLLRGLLLMKIPLHFHKTAIFFYSAAFKAYNSNFNECQDNEDVLFTCCGCSKVIENCKCQKIISSAKVVNSNLSEMGILEALVGDAALTAARYHIEDYVNLNCKGNFDILYKTILQDWLTKAVLGWLESVFCGEAIDPKMSKSFLNYKELLSYYLIETYATTRMEQLFNIIIEYPESQAALEDLRDCLEKTNLRTKLITSLKFSLETRLLHPGVSTEDILTAYISAIKALRVLDPTGVILQLASQPVCKYLRSREDTVRCIVSSLTDDSNSELMNELMRGAPLVLDDGCGYKSDDDEDAGAATGDWESWMPDPIDADPAKAPKSHRSSDIISILVNIYGTKELFVKEYQTLLAERLLTSFCFDTEREIRYLELLKLRFGESHLHYCEVMLKDVADSKRINSHINSVENMVQRNDEFVLDAMIVSAQFWPQLREDRMELPPVIKTAIEKYKKAFEALKGNRTLSWKPSLGLVSLEIELKDRVLELQVLPIQAGIILRFEEKPQWTIEELSLSMGSSASVIRRKITLWQSHGVLREEANDTFILVEESQGDVGGRHSVSHLEDPIMDEEEGDAIASSTKEQKEEELKMFWSFIVGMLTNLDTLPLEQIHNMLRMFAMQGPNASEWSIHELRQFLSIKVREEKLVYTNGVYKLST